jgi:hypothetical protein
MFASIKSNHYLLFDWKILYFSKLVIIHHSFEKHEIVQVRKARVLSNLRYIILIKEGKRAKFLVW